MQDFKINNFKFIEHEKNITPLINRYIASIKKTLGFKKCNIQASKHQKNHPETLKSQTILTHIFGTVFDRNLVSSVRKDILFRL